MTISCGSNAADLEFCGKHARKPAVIDMAVRHQQLFDGDTVLRRRRFQLVEVAARIDERAAHGARAPEQRAVLLQRRDRNAPL